MGGRRATVDTLLCQSHDMCMFSAQPLRMAILQVRYKCGHRPVHALCIRLKLAEHLHLHHRPKEEAIEEPFVIHVPPKVKLEPLRRLKNFCRAVLEGWLQASNRHNVAGYPVAKCSRWQIIVATTKLSNCASFFPGLCLQSGRPTIHATTGRSMRRQRQDHGCRPLTAIVRNWSATAAAAAAAVPSRQTSPLRKPDSCTTRAQRTSGTPGAAARSCGAGDSPPARSQGGSRASFGE